jgi:hypothetical protein
MARIETLTFRQFYDYDYDTDSTIDKIIQHLKKHKIKYQIVGITIIIFATGIFDTSVFATSTGGTGLDAGGRHIYRKLVGLGKWVIIIKGGFDSIQSAIKGDFGSAKSSFLQYLLIYIILLALPWSLNQIDEVFKNI